MSDARPPAAPPPRPSSAGGYLVMFAIGLLVGIMLVVVLLRALESRKTWQDRYPAALMQLSQAQMAQLSGALESDRCASSDVLPHLQMLRALSDDLDPAFPDLRDHRRFSAHAAESRRTLDAALSSPPVGCAQLRTTIDAVSGTCSACHQDMRG